MVSHITGLKKGWGSAFPCTRNATKAPRPYPMPPDAFIAKTGRRQPLLELDGRRLFLRRPRPDLFLRTPYAFRKGIVAALHSVKASGGLGQRRCAFAISCFQDNALPYSYVVTVCGAFRLRSLPAVPVPPAQRTHANRRALPYSL
jgi:hypothetical protein